MKAVVTEAMRKDRTVQANARIPGVDRMTLKRYMKKYEIDPKASMTSNYQKRLIFSKNKKRSWLNT